jgi:uncharacterized membrane protein
MERKESEFSNVIGLVLRYGVVVSFAIIALGSIMLFLEGQTGYYPLGTAEQLFDRQNHFLIGLVPLLQGVGAAKPYAIIDLGLLVLLATPIARVFISIFLFAEERRYAFVLITLTVLGLLLFSTFVLGPFLSG